MKPGWIVKTQIKQRGKWIDPLPGMDMMNAWFRTRREARSFRRLMQEARPHASFVLRRALK